MLELLTACNSASLSLIMIVDGKLVEFFVLDQDDEGNIVCFQKIVCRSIEREEVVF